MLHVLPANQPKILAAIDHVLDNAEAAQVPVPKRMVIRLRPVGWEKAGAKQHIAVWHTSPISWCAIDVVLGTVEETWLRLVTVLSAAVLARAEGWSHRSPRSLI